MEVTITPKFDCRSGKCLRYTIGKPGEDISGAVYIKEDSVLPETITLLLPAKEIPDAT